MTWTLAVGDCVELMSLMGESSVDAVVTDPPYGLEFMGKEWDRIGDVRQPGDATFHGTDTPNGRSKVRYGYNVSLGAMQEWHRTWALEALRVLKPGGHLLSFGGTRTYHRLVCALEDAGFEIRDCLAYLYGSGFPKSLNVSKDQRFCQGHEGDLRHGETVSEHDLRPVLDADVSAAVSTRPGQGALLLAGVPEPSASADRQTRSQSQVAGTEQPGVEGRRDLLQDARQLPGSPVRQGSDVGEADGSEGRLHHGAPTGDRRSGGTDAEPDGGRQPRRSQSGEQRPSEPGTVADEPRPQDGRAWPLCPRCSQPLVPPGLGTALKPAFEPIVLARKPLSGTVAENVLRHGVGALNVDGTRIGAGDPVPGGGGWAAHQVEQTEGWDRPYVNGVHAMPSHDRGRWPANVLLDADAAAALDEQSGESRDGVAVRHRSGGNTFGGENPKPAMDDMTYGGSGGASRFFYTAKTSRSERENGVAQYLPDKAEVPSGRFEDDAYVWPDGRNTRARNDHPTVKPVDLMQWLCRLITPPHGLILDPFTGSGSTGIAALREGFSFIGIEREPDYVEIARARIIGDAPLWNVSAEI